MVLMKFENLSIISKWKVMPQRKGVRLSPLRPKGGASMHGGVRLRLEKTMPLSHEGVRLYDKVTMTL